MRDLERERAADALAKVKKLVDRKESDEFKKRYRSYVDRLGGAIVMNGLGQALATELAAAEGGVGGEDKKAHQQLAKNLAAWLCQPNGVYPRESDIMAAITGNDQAAYVRAQMEALAWLTWHKKFCHANFPKGSDD